MTLPRNTQYDQPVYMNTIGSMNTVPIRRKTRVLAIMHGKLCEREMLGHGSGVHTV